MARFTCSVCGADLPVRERNQVVECQYCGNRNCITVFDDDAVGRLKADANRQFRRGDFALAIDRFRRVLAERPEDAEAHWFLALARYGVEYVEEPGTGKRVITCRRTQYDSILEDENYYNALSYTDPITRCSYEQEAARIDDLQQRILALCEEEEPFDVFLSYKEKEEGTNIRTRESETAEDLYYLLQRAGLRVFYAPMTLREKSVGMEYEPYIFAALSSARLIFVIGYTAAHLNAVWVKNEWSRYLDRMEVSQRLRAVLYFNSQTVHQEDLPPALANSCQLFDAAEGTSLSDLAALARAQFGKEETQEVATEDLTAEIDLSTLKVLASGGQYDRLYHTCDQWLDLAPEMGALHLYLLLAELRLPTLEALAEQDSCILADHRHFKRAMKYAAAQDRPLYEQLLQIQQTRQRQNQNYDVDLMKKLFVSNVTPELAGKVFSRIQTEEHAFDAMQGLLGIFFEDLEEEESQFTTSPVDELSAYLQQYRRAFQHKSDRYLDLVRFSVEGLLDQGLPEVAMGVLLQFRQDLPEEELDEWIERCQDTAYEWMIDVDWESELEDEARRGESEYAEMLYFMLQLFPIDYDENVQHWNHLLKQMGYETM